MMKHLLTPLALISCVLVACSTSSAQMDQIPHLEKRGDISQLIVKGKPFLALAGELHNSSASSPEYMKDIWPAFQGSGVNTVLAVVSWNQIEPVEGQFDFSQMEATAYYHNAGNNPPIPGIRGGRFSDPGSIEAGNNFFGLTKDMGWDMIRPRVWNEPRNENNGQPSNSPGNCSPANTLRVAKAVIGAGQKLAIDFHYADSWSDPQNQPKPYAWADLTFGQLQQRTHDYTREFVESLVKQGTTPSIVAIGNEVTNGMM